MIVGYARVSRGDVQTLDGQRFELEQAGAGRIFEDKASGGRWDRPELHRALDHLRSGDTLAVVRLDRLSRSLRDLLILMERIDEIGAGFRSLNEAIDTSGPGGRMMMQMIGAFAEYERSIIKERTHAGLREARRKGRRGGRPAGLTPEQEAEAVRLVTVEGRTQAEVVRLFDSNPATVSRAVSKARQAAKEHTTQENRRHEES